MKATTESEADVMKAITTDHAQLIITDEAMKNFTPDPRGKALYALCIVQLDMAEIMDGLEGMAQALKTAEDGRKAITPDVLKVLGDLTQAMKERANGVSKAVGVTTDNVLKFQEM